MNYRKIIFVCNDNTALSPMAAAIMRKFDRGRECGSRGRVVLFSEPYNPKIYSILKQDSVDIPKGASRPITNNDFGLGILVLTMDERQKLSIYKEYDKAANTYTLKEFVGEKGDIKEPYGQGMEAYYAVYEELTRLIIKVKEKIKMED